MGGTIESVIVARVEKKTGMIVESAVFAGTNPKEQNRLAEEHFNGLCEQYLTNWDDYTEADRAALLEDGVAESGKNIIQITHPENTLICPTGDPIKKVKDCYEGGVCPDCGKDIPVEAGHGDECLNCGHIFWFERVTDDPKENHDEFDPIKKGGIFIVAPSDSAPDEDKLHHICKATKAGDIYLDIYANDHYEVLGDRMSLATAKIFAKKHGCKTPRVI